MHNILLMLVMLIFVGCGGDSTPILQGKATVEVGPYETYYKWEGEEKQGCQLLWGRSSTSFGARVAVDRTYVLESNFTKIEGLEADTLYYAQVLCNGVYSTVHTIKTLPKIETVTVTPTVKNGEIDIDLNYPEYSNLKGYMIYVGEKNPFSKSEAVSKYYKELPSVNANMQKITLAQTIPNLKNNKTYYISVAPLIGIVESKLEKFYEVKPILDQPDANNSVGSATNNTLDLNVTNLTPDSVSFDWSDIKNTTAYVIYLNIQSNFDTKNSTTVVTTTEAESNASLHLLDCGRTYFVRLAGRDDEHIGPLSTEYTFTLPDLLQPETALSALKGNGSVTVNWTTVNHKDLTSYTLYVSDKANFTKAEAIQTLKNVSSGVVVSNLINNKTYYFSLAPNIRSWECGKESVVSATPELDITFSKIDTNKIAQEGEIPWAEVNVTRYDATISWEKINLATGYTVYFSTQESLDLDSNTTIKREVEGIDTLETTFKNLNYAQTYYYKVEAKDTTHQGPASVIYRFDIGEINLLGKKLSKLNDTGVYEDNTTKECASMTAWSSCTKSLDDNNNTIPFGQDGFYATGTKDRGKSLTAQGVCYKDDASKLLWYEEDNRSSYTYYLSGEEADIVQNGVQNIGETNCKIYSSDASNPVECNSKKLIEYVNANNPTNCNCDIWRLPTRDELRGMVYYGKKLPNAYVIKSKDGEDLSSKANYKPDGTATEYNYWSSDFAVNGTSTASNNYAWMVNLVTGEEAIYTRKTDARVVLVCEE